MSDSNSQISRRDLLKLMGTGAGMLAVGGAASLVPKRKRKP